MRFLATTTLLCFAIGAQATVLPAASYQRHAFTEPGSHEAVQKSGELSGGRWGITGWVEYQADVATTGWQELRTVGDAPAGVEFLVDADEQGNVPPERYFYQRTYAGSADARVGSIWLTRGRHRLRLVRYFWTGFPKISALELRPAPPGIAASMQVFFAGDQRVFRSGQCPQLLVRAGGGEPGEVEIVDAAADANRIHGRYRIAIPAGVEPATQVVQLACREEGFHTLSYRVDGRAVPAAVLPQVGFQVIGNSMPAVPARTADAPPLVDIDCSTQAPDYASTPGTRLQSLADRRYRESGDRGWIEYQRLAVADRSQRPQPSWFAYTLRGVRPGQRYRVEIEYPDDAIRTFAVAWRESSPFRYPVAIGIETGREHGSSGTMQRALFHTWARAAAPRLVFMSAHDGSRAACLRIRVYLASEPAAAPVPEVRDNRQFLNWYEEGDNFTGFFGASEDDPASFTSAAERWLASAAESGVDTLMPTVAIYNFAMYPSRFNRAFSEPQRDPLRTLLLLAERRRMRIIPELHPRADELAYARDERREPGNLAVSSRGANNFMGPAGRNTPPYFNALDPYNQEWYVGMARELAQRYLDSPAFQGISLRYMGWANAGLDNLVDLDWGYDDYTIGLYRKETRSGLPPGAANDAGRFQARHAWLMAHEKAAWIEWRCAKITQLLVRIRDAVRAARPDLQLYLHVFGPAVAGTATSGAGRDFLSKMQEAGLDLAAIAKLAGVVIVNSTFSYGRGEQDALFFNAARDSLLDPVAMGFSAGAGQWFLPTSRYLEATGDIVPPAQLGFPASTRQVWMSAASNPPGRRVLERYALLLAETDSLALGDGGNNYTLDSPLVAAFAREFRRLPRVHFEDVAGATDPVAVRAHAATDAYTFYAVNREPYPVKVSFELSGEGELATETESMRLQPPNQILDMELQPYELRVFTGTPAVRLTRVHTEVPATERRRIAARMDWVAGLLDGKAGVKAGGSDARLLSQAVTTARAAFERGALWQAHAAFENSAVLQAMRRLGCFPADMDLGTTPVAACRREQSP